MLRRFHAEGGQKSDEITVEYLNDWKQAELSAQPGLRAFEQQLAEGMTEPTGIKVMVLRSKLYEKLDDGERAQTYEKIFWENPDANMEQSVLNYYFNAGSWKAAKRFYLQARETVSRDVGFSNWLTPKAWMLGFLSGDEDLMKTAAEDSSSGSYIAMITVIWDAIAHDRIDEADAQHNGKCISVTNRRRARTDSP